MRISGTSEATPFASPLTAPSGSEPSAVEQGTSSGAAEHARTGGPAPFIQMLRGLGRELDRGENIAEKAIRGAGDHGGMSPARLIALQAGIYRYSEAVDLVTKVVDRGTQAVRTTLQNQ
jgi:hypothetical protein